MNRQERRRREKEQRRKSRQNKSSNRKKNDISPLEYHQVINSINAIKMASLLVLRNQGWGEKRLRRFSESFNEVLMDVSKGWLSLSDIHKMLEVETGLKLEELKVE